MARSLLPSEHGAWAQLGLPLAAVLVASQPRLVAVLLVAATFSAFLAHVPLARLVGRRGVAHGDRPWLRLSREERAATVNHAAVLVLGGGAIGVTALAFGGPEVATAALVPGVLAAAALGALALGRERTLAGEIIAAWALAAASVPVGVAGGMAMRLALAMWAAWVVAFAAATWAARLVLEHHRAPVPLSGRLAPLVSVVVLGAVLTPLAGTAVLTALPTLALCGAVCLAPPKPQALKRVGWGLAVTSTLTGATLAWMVLRAS